jgi:copper resistance protein B
MKRPYFAVALASCAACLFTAPAEAQMTMGAPSAAAPFGAPVDDEHVFYHLLFDQLEGRVGRDGSFRWVGEGWAGTDMNRIVLKSEGRVTNGVMEDGDQEVLYARPISTYFNVQGGLSRRQTRGQLRSSFDADVDPATAAGDEFLLEG